MKTLSCNILFQQMTSAGRNTGNGASSLMLPGKALMLLEKAGNCCRMLSGNADSRRRVLLQKTDERFHTMFQNVSDLMLSDFAYSRLCTMLQNVRIFGKLLTFVNVGGGGQPPFRKFFLNFCNILYADGRTFRVGFFVTAADRYRCRPADHYKQQPKK